MIPSWLAVGLGEGPELFRFVVAGFVSADQDAVDGDLECVTHDSDSGLAPNELVADPLGGPGEAQRAGAIDAANDLAAFRRG